jgi:hypothetical protein
MFCKGNFHYPSRNPILLGHLFSLLYIGTYTLPPIYRKLTLTGCLQYKEGTSQLFQQYRGDLPSYLLYIEFFVEILQCVQYIHSFTFIRRGSSPFPHRWSAQWGKNLPGMCRAKYRTQACLTAGRRTYQLTYALP